MKSRKMRKSRKSRKIKKRGGSPMHTITFTFPLSRHNPDDWDDRERVIINEQDPGVRDEAIRYLTNLTPGVPEFLQDLMHSPPGITPLVVSNPIAIVNDENEFRLTINVNQGQSAALDGWIRSVVDHLEESLQEGYMFGPFPLNNDRYWQWS